MTAATEPTTNRHFIDGTWHGNPSAPSIRVMNPATEEVLAEVPAGRSEDVDLAVRAAHAASQGTWRVMHPSDRGALLWRLASLVRQHRDSLAELETLNAGKPIGQARGEIEGVAKVLEYNAGAADKIHGESIPIGHDYFDFTLCEPLGVTAHITPWNSPLAMAARSVAPALAAGCTVVVKPAEQTPLTTLRFASLAKEAGFPDGVVNVVTGYGHEAGASLVAHELVRGVTFTGSVATGRDVMASAARGVKPVVLELGGKSPLVVFADANLELAAAAVVKGILTNSGQVCVASSRLLIDAEIKQDFLARVADRFQQVRLGPGIEDPDMGPLVSKEHYDRVLSYVVAGVDEGASVVTGGGRPEGRAEGYFVQPTLLDGVRSGSRVAQEEIFGPVLSVIDFTTEDEALVLANDVPYGLAAGVFTSDISRALRLARGFQAGSVWVNDWFAGGVQAPVGGYKESGIGRERGLHGIRNYVQVKNIAVRIGSR